MRALVGGKDRHRAPVLQDVDARLLGDKSGELADQPASGRRSAGVDHAPHRVAALEPEREVAAAIGVEGHPETDQAPHRLGCVLGQDAGGRLADHLATSLDGVGAVQLGAVLVGHRRGQAALGPVG